MMGGVGSVIVIDNVFVSLPAALVALMVKGNVPVVVGIPEINPAAESVKPVGRLSLSNDHVMGVPPLAVSCALYATSTVPFVSVVVIIAGACRGMITATIAITGIGTSPCTSHASL